MTTDECVIENKLTNEIWKQFTRIICVPRNEMMESEWNNELYSLVENEIDNTKVFDAKFFLKIIKAKLENITFWLGLEDLMISLTPRSISWLVKLVWFSSFETCPILAYDLTQESKRFWNQYYQIFAIISL